MIIFREGICFLIFHLKKETGKIVFFKKKLAG
jgi:hypothetical protein